MSMQCPACQRENPEGSRFCNACGATLARTCPDCGRANSADARFCNGCGRALAESAAPEPPDLEPRSYTPRHLAERILRSRSALEGERKHVTVLFCDVAGSTGIAERLGPEPMHALMDRCFRILLEEVHRTEGTVNQFLGDGLMALFGAPVALEDAPRRAVAAALGMRRALAPLAEEVRREHGVDLRLRMGIHSGPVVVGRVGDDLRMDYTAVGDTTNLAARLQGLAPPGGILISEATRQLAAGFFELRDVGVQDVRGRSAPVRAFEVLAERPVSGRVEARAAEGLTPLVGREEELAMLARCFDDARAGRGRLVFVVGEAGMGKSRLLYELRRRLGAQPHLWLEGHCASFARNTPFFAVADALRRAFRVEDSDDDAAALAKVEAGEQALGGGLEWTLPYVRQLLSLPSGDPEVDRLDAATRRSETFRAVAARFLRAAERTPLVLVVEDLHWIDRASEELLEFLGASVPTARALLLLTHRPGYRQPFGDHSYHRRVTLEALTARDMDRMVGALLRSEGLPPALRALIARKAEGNPFFVEEVIQSLVEEGVLRRRGDRVELARDLADVTIPDSIQDVLMARLDRLDAEPKRALQVASVIGREFALRLLARIHDAGDGVRAAVDELRALELIYQKAVHPELAFMFKHALTHDVAYTSVLEQRRRGLHRLVGAAIEELYGDRLGEHVEALAHHFTEGEEWEKALRYHERASAKAESAFANQSAAEHCHKALAIAERMGDVPAALRRTLEERLGGVCFATSRFREGGEAFERAAALAEDPEDRALDLGRAGHVYLWGHEYERVERVTRQGLDAARAAGSRDGEAYSLLVCSFREAVRGNAARDAELMAQALRCEPAHDEVRALAAYLQGQQREWTGDFPTAERHHAEAVEIARKRRLPLFLLPATWFRGKTLVCVGRYAEAAASLREALDLAERLGDRAMRGRILNTLGWLHAEVGDPRGASEFNRRSIDVARELLDLGLVAGANELLGNASVNLAGDRIALGDPGGADEALGPVREELGAPGDPWMRWRYGLHLVHAEGLLALAGGDPERALAWAERERDAARGASGRKLEARALELEARAHLAMDRRKEAERAAQAAAEIAEAIGYPPVRWRAAAVRAELLRRDGRMGEAREMAAAGRGLVEELAAALPDDDLCRSLRALGERLASVGGIA